LVTFIILQFGVENTHQTIPLLRCLSNQVEDSKIIYISDKESFAVVEKLSYIYKTIEWGWAYELKQKLKEEEVDYVIDLVNSGKSERLVNKLKLISFIVPVSYWNNLLVKLKLRKPEPDLPLYLLYFKAVSVFDVSYDDQGFEV